MESNGEDRLRGFSTLRDSKKAEITKPVSGREWYERKGQIL